VFLLCTTEAHKIPTTIASRCQQFNFRSVDFNELIARMEEIARLEGIDADKETLGVLAQAGEGSVRDSLSALDQAIACCGNKLNPAEVRELLGMFAAESLEQVAHALAAGDTKKMLEIVAELEANGRGLQHFARELARYIRNLLVIKIEGAPSRLVAATPAEQERLSGAAALFREEDLTRFLKLTLDLFTDMQTSLQPRLHLEMGLLRLVHAARLQPIEEALAALGGSAPAAPVKAASRTMPPSKPSSQAAPSAEVPPVSPSAGGDLRSRLHGTLLEAKRTHLADAIEHSEVSESESEVVFTTPRMYQAYLKGPEFENAVKQAVTRPVRITVKVGEVTPQPAAVTARQQDDTADRALAHPEVKKFQELFPGSQVRTVRNLRENEV
jgi:DNA polymerase-3 subunit gamma/tau